ncbi:contractile injection system protein, VgrG/Pvc8 family [Vibrio hannami]|uniref:contractile injection system protein, VgrG/Pvc8 family n=1 Tax=Vibrio hannami TaxID=2717094 RepID=UPI00241040DE|nr:contractile injection system protein, VgrG/Pvc8 family [Vibrio hannami]MDG3089141.1 contractile injection system protein, VgrG/Pvc8 family [Vibrio hannami]
MAMIVRFEGNGADLIHARLLTWELTDDKGRSSDILSVSLDAESMGNIPESGREFGFYIDDEYRGKFQIADISEDYWPPVINITLTSGKFTVNDPTGLKEARTRTFKNTTFGAIVNEVMTPHGYIVKVEPDLSAKVITHANQEQEEDDDFISRLAERYDAISKPVDGLYVVAKSGNRKAMSGQDIPPATIPEASIIKGKLSHPSKRVFKGVKVKWFDSETAKSGEVVIGSAPFKAVRNQYKNESDAREKADSELYRATRKGQSLNLTVQGQKGIFAESIISIDNPLNERFSGDWSTDTVLLSGDKTKYSINIQATRPRN